MKLKLAAATVAIMLSQGAMAQGQPQSCPAVAQLQAVGVTIAMQDQQAQGQWFGVTPNNTFGTNNEWTFAAGPVESQSQQGVLEAVNQKLSTLGEGMGPIASDDQDQQEKMYICFYTNQSSDFVGITVTPPFAMDGVTNLLHKRLMKK